MKGPAKPSHSVYLNRSVNCVFMSGLGYFTRM